jgi:hypothetical protein
MSENEDTRSDFDKHFDADPDGCERTFREYQEWVGRTRSDFEILMELHPTLSPQARQVYLTVLSESESCEESRATFPGLVKLTGLPEHAVRSILTQLSDLSLVAYTPGPYPKGWYEMRTAQRVADRGTR